MEYQNLSQLSGRQSSPLFLQRLPEIAQRHSPSGIHTRSGTEPPDPLREFERSARTIRSAYRDKMNLNTFEQVLLKLSPN